MRYYEQEHFDAYARIKREGLEQWNDLHPSDSGSGYDQFSSRSFLDRMMPAVEIRSATVLEYGCGTGAAACFLAERGYRVHAVDFVPDAIEMARVAAAERGLSVRFEIEDICRWDAPQRRYDYIVDSFCLQSIVTDADRSKLLRNVRLRLNPDGKYLISTAMYSTQRDYGQDHYDAETGIVWIRASEPQADAKLIDGAWCVPNRRHLTVSALRSELEIHRFTVVEQSGPAGGDVVCEPA